VTRAGDGDRLTGAIAAASSDLLAYFERRSSNPDAADLLAETMITAWRRVDALPVDDEQARMWLFGIARNVLLNAGRGQRRRWQLADRVRGMLTADAIAGPADEGMEVRDAISRLEPDLAELVRLIHWDGFSIVEAASIMEIPASTARGRYQRAKGELRTALAVSTES